MCNVESCSRVRVSRALWVVDSSKSRRFIEEFDGRVTCRLHLSSIARTWLVHSVPIQFVCVCYDHTMFRVCYYYVCAMLSHVLGLGLAVHYGLLILQNHEDSYRIDIAVAHAVCICRA